MTQYLVICGILSKNNCVAFCNPFPKTESSPAREENTLPTHHNQLSLWNKSCWDWLISILNWRLLTIMPLPINPLRPKLTRPTRPIKPMRLKRPIRLMPLIRLPRPRPMKPTRPRPMKPFLLIRPSMPRPMKSMSQWADKMKPRPMRLMLPICLPRPMRLRSTQQTKPPMKLTPRPMKLTPRPIWPISLMSLLWPKAGPKAMLLPVAANALYGANASNAAWVVMADANESNDGKFDFCQMMTLSSFQLFALSWSPSQNIAKPLLKWRNVLE